MSRRCLISDHTPTEAIRTVTLSDNELRTLAWAAAWSARDWAVKYGRGNTVTRRLKLATFLFNVDGSSCYFKLSSRLTLICADKPFGRAERERRREQNRHAHARYMASVREGQS